MGPNPALADDKADGLGLAAAVVTALGANQWRASDWASLAGSGASREN